MTAGHRLSTGTASTALPQSIDYANGFDQSCSDTGIVDPIWKTLAWILSQKHSVFAFELLAFAEEQNAQIGAKPALQMHADEPALEGRLSLREAIDLTQEAWREVILPTLRELTKARTSAA